MLARFTSEESNGKSMALLSLHSCLSAAYFSLIELFLIHYFITVIARLKWLVFYVRKMCYLPLLDILKCTFVFVTYFLMPCH